MNVQCGSKHYTTELTWNAGSIAVKAVNYVNAVLSLRKISRCEYVYEARFCKKMVAKIHGN